MKWHPLSRRIRFSSGAKSDTPCDSGAGGYFALADDQLEWNLTARLMRHVQLKEFRDHPLKLGFHLLNRRSFSDEAGNVRISHVPDTSLRVP